MSTSTQPRVLVVTSQGAPRGAVTPVLAALEAAGLEVRAIDVGRAGARGDGALDWVVRTVAGEVAERRLLREMSEHPPDVTVAFDPATATALSVVRDEAARPAPVLAVVGELRPSEEWGASDADRYAAIDDEAAVDLADHGIDGERILTVGPVCERAFAEAAREDRGALRRRFGIDGSAPVVVVEVAGLGYELTSQVALQLSLLSANAMFLFDAATDSDAATALRRQVPTLDIRAKLFGHTEDAPLLWRCADVVIARPTDAAVSRALVLGASMVAFVPESREDKALAEALVARRRGATAGNPLLLASALEPLLGARRKADELVGADGAATIADIAWIVAGERREVLEERSRQAWAGTRERVHAAASAAEAAARTSAAAGGLEDLSGGGASYGAAAEEVPDAKEIARLRAEVRTRMSQVSKTVSEAGAAAERWDKRLELARQKGDDTLTREAERSAEAERRRMHEALAEMAQLQAELERLDKAAAQAPPPRASRSSQRPAGASAGSRGSTSSGSAGSSSSRAGSSHTPPRASSTAGGARSIDDMVEELKRKHGAQQTTLDDELAALKRKMQSKKKR